MKRILNLIPKFVYVILGVILGVSVIGYTYAAIYNPTGGGTSVTFPITVAQGGTNATTSAVARTNLGLGSISTFSSTDYLSSSTSYVSSLTASSSIGLSTSTGTVNIGAKNYPLQWIIESPSASENDAIFTFNATSTITACNAVNKSAGDTVTFGLGYSSSRATATSSLSNLFTSAQTVTATTTPVALTINGSSTPGSLNPLIFWTTAASSTQFTLTCFYAEN